MTKRTKKTATLVETVASEQVEAPITTGSVDPTIVNAALDELLGDIVIPDDASDELPPEVLTSEIIPEGDLLDHGAIVDHHSQLGNWDAEQAVASLDPSFVGPMPMVAEAPASEVESFSDIMAKISDEAADTMAFATRDALDDRARFEMAKNADNEAIQKKLVIIHGKLVTKRAARVMIATSVDADFMNQGFSTNAHYNVYAIEKAADFIAGLSGGSVKNAINVATMKSLFACAKAGITFDFELAKACASNKVPVLQAGVRQHLTRHTVSESTAPTQAGSTMRALVTLGVVSKSGQGKNPVFTLREDQPVTQRLRELLAA